MLHLLFYLLVNHKQGKKIFLLYIHYVIFAKILKNWAYTVWTQLNFLVFNIQSARSAASSWSVSLSVSGSSAAFMSA